MNGGMVMPKLPGVHISVLSFVLIVGCGQGASTDDQSASDAAATQEAERSGTDATKEPPSPDAGIDADGGTFASVGQLRLFNGLCLPNSLPTSGTGTVACRILLTGVAGGCEQVGLSTANSADVAAIEAASRILGPVPTPVCEMNQLAPDANCTAESVLGWCYRHGSCLEDAGRVCAQAICTTGGFEGKFISDGKYTDFSAAWLVCP